jgi:hypothetical protein
MSGAGARGPGGELAASKSEGRRRVSGEARCHYWRAHVNWVLLRTLAGVVKGWQGLVGLRF